MKESLMDILCDPLDKGEFELEVDERGGDEIIEGRLIGTVTSEVYPIEDGIPNLLPPDMRDDWGDTSSGLDVFLFSSRR